MIKESVIEKYLVTRVKELGGRCVKFTSPGTRGVSDRICFMPYGVTAMIELKRPGEELAPLQAKWLRDMTELGHYAAWADSKEEIDTILYVLEDKMWEAKCLRH